MLGLNILLVSLIDNISIILNTIIQQMYLEIHEKI